MREIEENERIEHHCSIVGVYLPDPSAVDITRSLLFHSNNRGQEGSMMVTVNGDGKFERRGGAGWVSQAYKKNDLTELREQNPVLVVGQNRYSTSGELNVYQPFVPGIGVFDEKSIQKVATPAWESHFLKNQYAVAHNGTLTNATNLLEQLPNFMQLLAPNDTGVVFLHLSLAKGSWPEKIREVVTKCEGAFNLIIAAEGKIYAYRDPWGFRPLSLGRISKTDANKPDGFVVSSENGPYLSVGVNFLRDVLPGEGVVIDETGIKTFFIDERTNVINLSRCIFETVYFSSPDSIIFGQSVSRIRRVIGRALARKDIERGFLPDVIIPVQHSGIPFAEGYAQELISAVVKDPKIFKVDPDDKEALAKIISGLQTQTGLVANIYANGRSFIDPTNRVTINEFKHRADPEVVSGKKVAVIDDSTVRGNTDLVAGKLLRKAGAREIHKRNGFGIVRHPCYQGIDFAEPNELIVNRVGEEKIRETLGFDSIDFISPRELLEIVVGKEKMKEIDDPSDTIIYQRGGYCGACIIKERSYPVDVSRVFRKVMPETQ